MYVRGLLQHMQPDHRLSAAVRSTRLEGHITIARITNKPHTKARWALAGPKPIEPVYIGTLGSIPRCHSDQYNPIYPYCTEPRVRPSKLAPLVLHPVQQ